MKSLDCPVRMHHSSDKRCHACEPLKMAPAKPWEEPWEADEDDGTLYHGMPHSATWEIAKFASKNAADPGNANARARLAAAAPDMAAVLIKLLKGKKRRKVMPDVHRALRLAGVIT